MQKWNKMTATKTCRAWKLSPWEKTKQIQSKTQTENNANKKSTKTQTQLNSRLQRTLELLKQGKENSSKRTKIKNSGDEHSTEQN